MEQRVGFGYDVHRLRPGKSIRLGGIDIPSTVTAEGHSDADVLIHAIMDACLGAAGLPDIGHYFPPSDPQWKDADSMVLFRQVIATLAAEGWEVNNIDSVVITESPRLAPHIPAMKNRIAQVAGITPDRVGVKATTNEGIGFIGRGEGIAAQAVVLLQRAMP